MPRSSKIFRIFVSSTFSDLKHERTVLQRDVFPELQLLCEQYGAKFQAIDLRWGVRDEAQLDHKTLEICLNELQRCKELSPRPNFLILLGNRYGWRPIPTEIKKGTFEPILAYYESTNETSYKLLKEWYIEDVNSLPATYCLQPREGKYIDHAEWNIVEQSLRLIFDHVIAELSLQDQEIGEHLLSATEHEIRAGAFQQEDAKDHVFAFIRSIQGLPNDHRAADFRDVTSEGNINIQANKQLDGLKKAIHSLLPEKNIKQYEVNWQETDIDTTYLKEFSKDVIAQLKPIIERECQDIEQKDIVEVEKEKHQQFGIERVRNFVGREQLFSQIEKRLETTSSPILIWGESGSGKTAFAAEFANRLHLNRPNAKVIQRFIGASAFGMNTEELLASILLELMPEESENIIGHTEISDLLDLLEVAYLSATKKNPIYIVIDALDHLTDQYLLPKWLPIELPEHVHWVVSVAEDSKAYPLLKGIIQETNIFLIEPLSVQEGRSLLQKWLGEESRTLQSDQYEMVIEAFKKCPLPLFLKLAYEEVKLWKSYSEYKTIQPSIGGIIEQFINRISDHSYHGPVLIRHVFGLLAASKTGLEETELLELLSQSDEMMEDFQSRAKHDYIDNNLPPVIWARLFNDLEPYLFQKKEGGTLVYSFYHRQLEAKVKEAYLTADFHHRLASYFDKKPTFLDRDKVYSNRRKVTELPYQLYQTKDVERFENILTDFEFLQGKISSKLSQDLLHDFSLLRELMNDQGLPIHRIGDFERFCRIRHTLLLQYPERLKVFALQLGPNSFVFQESVRWHEERGLPYMKGHESNFTNNRLLHIFNMDDTEASICKIHPNGQEILVASGELVKVWNLHTGNEVSQYNPKLGIISDMDIVYHSNPNLVSICGEKGIKVLDLQSFAIYDELNSKYNFQSIAIHPNYPFVAVVNEAGDILLRDMENDENFWLYSDDYTKVFKVKWHPLKPLLAIWYDSHKILIWDYQGNCEFKILHTHYQWEKYVLHASFYDLAFASDSNLLYSIQDFGLTIWDISLGIRVNNTVSLAKGNHLLDGQFVFSVLYNNEIKVWDYDGYHYFSTDHNYFQLHQYATIHKGKLAVITQDGRVIIWELTEMSKKNHIKKIKMMDESYWWVLAPYIYEVKSRNVLSRWFKPSLTDKIVKQTGNNDSSLKQLWENKLLSFNRSPKKSYIATGHLGDYLQVKNIKDNSITQFKPYKTDSIVYTSWSWDESLVFYGTTKRAWVMTPKGRLKKTIVANGEINYGCWSSVKKQLLVLFSDGTAQLIDFDENWTEEWKLDVNNNSQLTGSWSNRGDYFVICYHRTFLLYQAKKNPQLKLKGDISETIHQVSWSPNDQHLTFVNKLFEAILISPKSGEILSNFNIVKPNESRNHSSYYKYMVSTPSDRIQLLYSLIHDNQGNNLEDYIDTLPFQLLVSWNKSQQKIAFAYGYWLTILYLNDLTKRINWYVDDGIYDLEWDNDDLFVLTGENFHEEKYLVMDGF